MRYCIGWIFLCTSRRGFYKEETFLPYVSPGFIFFDRIFVNVCAHGSKAN